MYSLKYRPHTVADLDNLAPAETIRTILKSKTLPHAFLFIGQKGTGKRLLLVYLQKLLIVSQMYLQERDRASNRAICAAAVRRLINLRFLT